MLRRLFTILSAVSLLLWLLMFALSVWAGFSPDAEYTFQRADGSYLVSAVAIPPHSLLPILGVLPAIWFVAFWFRHQRRRAAWRHRHALCARCGYDLRATPGRCPECGLAPTGAT